MSPMPMPPIPATQAPAITTPRRSIAVLIAATLSLALLTACSPDTTVQIPKVMPTQPLAVDTPPPTYPPELACADVGGEVGLIMQITADGRISDVRVENGSGHAALDEAAVAAVKAWRFEPATSRGEPVESDLRVPVTFTPPTMRPQMCFQLDEQR
ncbi:energy transducer TonB [Lysobacter sp. A286]